MGNTEPRANTTHRSLTTVLADLEGDFLQRANEQLGELIRQIQDVAFEVGGKTKGSMRIDLTFVLEGRQVDVRPKITVNAPEAPEMRTSFFTTENHQLTRHDPRSPELPFRDVSVKQETRSI